MTDVQIRITDYSLFGNDAAEDENDEVFRSYVVEREEVAAFVDPGRTLVSVL